MPTQDEITRIIESTDMVDLVSPFVKLTKQGKSYKGLCPFHNEDTPSFVVSQEKHIAHCFGCGKGGNPISFLMQIKQISFNEALAELAQKNGIKIAIQRTNKKEQDFTKYYEMMQMATKFYNKNLTTTRSGLEALEYLHKRGLDDETIKMFQIGLAPQNLTSLYGVLKESNYLELDMMDLGLINKGEQGYYDLFTRRIMFPIADEQGRIIGFSGRIFNNSDKSQPKYVNTKETFLYKKGTVLYHLDLAKSEILRKKRVILHEGQLDVIAATRAGFKEAICTMGTALTFDQVLVLKKYTTSAVICYDGDKAGIQASKKAIELFKRAGMSVHLVLLPDGMDPDEFILKQGKEAYVDYFDSHLMDEHQYLFETAFLNKDLQDESILQSLKEELFALISRLTSQTSQENYLNRLAQRLQASSSVLLKDYNAYCNAYPVEQSVEFPQQNLDFFDHDETTLNYQPVQTIQTPQRKYELRLFMYARTSKEKAFSIDRRLGEYMEGFSPKLREIWVTLINNYYYQYDSFEDKLFSTFLTEDQKTIYFDAIEAVRSSKEIYNDTDLECCIEKMKQQSFLEKNKVITSQLLNSNSEEAILKKLAEKFENRKKIAQTKGKKNTNIRRK